jgi:hypothetical protein
MINSETRTLGLYRDQKISTILAGVKTPTFGINGAGFIMTELCSYEKEISTPPGAQNSQFISSLMLASNTSPLANDFKANASINIFLSCMLPIPNIINEATSYSVEGVQEGIGVEPGEIRDIIFKPVKIQNKICTKVSKDLLKNV